jgi:hypothetical protein
LDKLRDQIQIEILDPLLCAPSREQLAQSFDRLFPVYVHYYLSSALILWGHVHGDAQRFSALTIRSYREAEHLISDAGPHWIGQNAALTAVQGMTNIIRVSKATLRLLEGAREVKANPNDALLWSKSVMAYGMAFSSVLSAITALANGTISPKLENIATLAEWSKAFSVQAYHLTKVMGLVKEPGHTAPLPESTDEDIALVNADLEDFAEMLVAEDRG